jgi:hypothetical protein
MRSMGTVLGVVVLALVAGVANAGSNWVGVSGGLGFPTSDYSEAVSTGWHLGATGTHMIDSQWGIGADLGYHSWGGSRDANRAAEAAFGNGSEFKWSAVQATAQGIMAFPTQSQARPFATLGFGAYNVTSKLQTPSGDSHISRSEFGINFGGGFDLSSRRDMKWRIAGTYHTIPARSDLGTDLSFFELGVNALWGSRR